MGFFDRFLSRKKSVLALRDLPSYLTSNWDSINVNEQYSKSLYVFACINVIAKKVAAIDYTLHSIINSKGETKQINTHPVLDLLYKVNPYQTRSDFWQITMINKKLRGEAFWLKVRDSRGQVIELWNLPPDRVTIIAAPQTYIKHYELLGTDGKTTVIQPTDIVHFKQPNPSDSYRGLSPILPAKSRILTEQYATEYQRDFFANGARPDGVITTPDEITREQGEEILSAWEKRHKGVSSRPALMAGGMKYDPAFVTAKEMDYIESLKFTRNDICVAFGVPSSMITLDEMKYSNAETGLRMFLAETITPEVSAMVETINEMMVVPDFSDRLYLDFQDPTPEDRQTQLAEYSAGVDKWMTRNEIRASLNLEPIEGGDSLFNPLGVQAIDAPATVAEDNSEKVFKGRHYLKTKLELVEGMADDVFKSIKKPKKKKESLLKDKTVRLQYETFVNKKIDKRAEKFKKSVEAETARQRKRVVNSLAKSIKSIPIKFDKKKENQIFSELALPFMVDAAKESGQDALDLLGTGETFDYTATLEKKLKDRAKLFASSVNDTTLDKLSRTLAEGIESGESIAELSARVSEVYEEFPTYRSDLIARTETTAVNNEGFLEAYSQSDIVTKQEWVATQDDRTRDEHLAIDGEVVKVGDNFSNGLPYPQEPNCRCVLAPVV